MHTSLTRKIVLTDEEVAEAVKYWLVNKHDVQLGDNPIVNICTLSECEITSSETADIALPED